MPRVRDTRKPAEPEPYIDPYTTPSRQRRGEVHIGQTVIEIGHFDPSQVIPLLDEEECPHLKDLRADKELEVEYRPSRIRLIFSRSCKAHKPEEVYHYLRDNLFPNWKEQDDAEFLLMLEDVAA